MGSSVIVCHERKNVMKMKGSLEQKGIPFDIRFSKRLGGDRHSSGKSQTCNINSVRFHFN